MKKAAPKRESVARSSAPRSHAQRREDTIQALHAATIRLMLKQGFTRMTTPDIAREAGVSRGALTHYFASREELIVSAIDNHLRGINERLFAFAEQVGAEGGSSDKIVDYLWEIMSDGLFYMTLEYLPEARHNPPFRDALIPVVQEFHRGLDAIWSAHAADAGVTAGRSALLLNMTMCLFRGMIAQTILRDDPAYYAAMLTEWKAQLPRWLGNPPAS